MNSELLAGLRSRRTEIEQAVLVRACSVSDPIEIGDLSYTEGLKNATAAAIGYALEGLELGDPRPGPIPGELFSQVRRAARADVSLDTVMRRYLAGHTLLNEFIMREGASGTLPVAELNSLIRTQAMLVDHLIAEVSAEYRREVRGRLRSGEHRKAERIRRLLSGELLDAPDLGYLLDAWHLGAVAKGPGASRGLRDLSTALDRSLLLVRADEATIWAWLGGRSTQRTEAVLRTAAQIWPRGTALALGVPGFGTEGWRLTHRQARAAHLVASRRDPATPVCYEQVALLAAVLTDHVLLASLQQLYLRPLAMEEDGGESLRQTLRAYFAAGRNISSAAAAIGVSRPTVTSRLRAVEARVGHRLDECSAEMETALQLQDCVTINSSPLQP